MKKSYRAFTLFEILLSMLLMAIIAVSILPGITKNAEQQLFVTQLKKVQNDLKQAMLIISARNKNDIRRVFNNPAYGANNPLFPPAGNRQPGNALNNYTFALAIRSALDAHSVYFAGDDRTTGNQITSPSEQAQLFANRNPHYMDLNKTVLYNEQNGQIANFTPPANFAALNLKNGATVRVVIRDNNDRNCNTPEGGVNNVCGYLEVDLNGVKRPNVVGKDIHNFWIVNNDDGIVPWGENDNQQCQLNNGTFVNITNTLGCTYQVLSNGKITYY